MKTPPHQSIQLAIHTALIIMIASILILSLIQ